MTSKASRGGEIGANSSGRRRGLIGLSLGTHMLKRKEKPPEGVIIPMSPILMPFF